MIIDHTTQNLNSSSVAYYNSRKSLGKQKIQKSTGYDTTDVSFTGCERFLGSKGLQKVLENEKFGKLLDLAGKNPVLTTALYSLGLCAFVRPATIMALPGKNVDDKKYASAHSISSGVIGFVVTLLIMTPIAAMVSKVFKNPAKFLKPEMVKKLYPNVAIETTTNAAGKTVRKIKFDSKEGKMLQNEAYEKLRQQEIKDLKASGVYEKLEKSGIQIADDGVLCTNLEPLMLSKPDGKMEVIRSTRVFKTNSKGEKVGCALQANGTPITDELEVGAQEFENLNKLVNMGPDLLIAQPRAAITVATIPAVLSGVFGMKKSKKKGTNNTPTAALVQTPIQQQNIPFQSANVGKIPDYSNIFPGLRRGGQ